MTNTEILQADPKTLSALDRQRQYVLRIALTPMPCVCNRPLDQLDASGLKLDDFPTDDATNPAFKCPTCHAELECTVPLWGPVYRWQKQGDVPTESPPPVEPEQKVNIIVAEFGGIPEIMGVFLEGQEKAAEACYHKALEDNASEVHAGEEYDPDDVVAVGEQKYYKTGEKYSIRWEIHTVGKADEFYPPEGPA